MSGEFPYMAASQHWKARDVMATTHWTHHNHFAHYGRAGFHMFSTGYTSKLDDEREPQMGPQAMRWMALHSRRGSRTGRPCHRRSPWRRQRGVGYRRTRNLRAVQLLLGHSKLESTVRYLGIEVARPGDLGADGDLSEPIERCRFVRLAATVRRINVPSGGSIASHSSHSAGRAD